MTACLLWLAACQTTSRPAMLADVSPGTMKTLNEVLGAAVGRAQVTLVPGDMTRQTTVSVLPPPPGPNEGNSLVMPALFDLVMRGRNCFVRARADGGMHRLPDVECRPAGLERQADR